MDGGRTVAGVAEDRNGSDEREMWHADDVLCEDEFSRMRPFSRATAPVLGRDTRRTRHHLDTRDTPRQHSAPYLSPVFPTEPRYGHATRGRTSVAATVRFTRAQTRDNRPYEDELLLISSLRTAVYT